MFFSCQEALQNIAREIEIHVNLPRHHYALLIPAVWTLLGDNYATSKILLNLCLHIAYDYLCVIHIDCICPWLYTFFALQFLFSFFIQLLKQYLSYFVNIFDLWFNQTTGYVNWSKPYCLERCTLYTLYINYMYWPPQFMLLYLISDCEIILKC